MYLSIEKVITGKPENGKDHLNQLTSTTELAKSICHHAQLALDQLWLDLSFQLTTMKFHLIKCQTTITALALE